MKTSETDARCKTKITQLRKLAKVRSNITSIQLLFVAFAFVVAFGAVMKIVSC